MTDETVVTMPNGSKGLPSTSVDIASCPDGNCPQYGSSWTGGEKRITFMSVTMPQGITGGAG